MLQNYKISSEGDGVVAFSYDDTATVREMMTAYFQKNGYTEPFGMDIVTVYQAFSPRGNTGWFVADAEARCADVIDVPDCLCIAYHMPGVFYFAEGGWGHHMATMGNAPALEEPVGIHLCFEGFNNTVMLAGRLTFTDIVDALKRVGYLKEDVSQVCVCVYGEDARKLPLGDARLKLPLKAFAETMTGFDYIVLE